MEPFPLLPGKPVLRMSEKCFHNIFEEVGLSIWEEDFTEVKELVEAMITEGVRDVRRYLVDHPEVVDRAIGLVKILDVNPATIKIFGATSRLELLQSLHNIFVPETSAIFLEVLVAIAEHKKYFESEALLKTLQGDRLNVLVVISFPSADQAFDRVVVTLADITKQKQVEEALRKSEGRSRALMEAITSIIWTTDAKGRFETFQSGWAQYTGQSLEEMRDFGWLNAIHPDDRKTIVHMWDAACHAETRYQAAGRLWHAQSGTYREFETRGVPIRNENGVVQEWIGECIDVEDRKQVEEALRESEQRFNTFMQHLPGLAWIKDLQGRYVYVNDSAELVFHTPRESLYGKTDEEIFPENVAAQFRENDRQALTNKNGVQTGETLQHQDGVLHHSMVSKFPILGPAGRPIMIGGIAIDITSRKQTDEALREREEQYELVVTGAEAAIWDWDVLAKRIFYSSRWKEMRGLSDAEVSDREEEWSSRIHPDDFARVMERVQAHFEGRTKVFREEYRVRHKDGHWLWIGDHGIVKRNEMGIVIRMAVLEIDITSRKQTEKALLESETEARRLLKLNQIIMSNMGEGMYTLDSKGLVTYVNPEAERMFGWKSSELLGRAMHEVTHYKYPDGSPFPMEECAGFQVRHSGKILRNIEDNFIKKDGSFFPVSYSVSPLRDHGDEIIGLVIVFQDITERKQAEEELRRWKNELEIRVHERTRELVSSQEQLRWLASQLSLTEERERRKLARDLHDYLVQLLVVGCMKLDQMKNISPPNSQTDVAIQDLGNILQQALIYSRTTIAELCPPNFHESGLPMALNWLAKGMENHGLRVEVHTGHHTPQLSEDRVILLFQSVRELLFNVLKHAGVQQATVKVSSESGGDVCITVEDRGKGLDPGTMQRTPEPGHLGLFAVRERMGAMGGRVALTSAPGKGTCVRLLLPAHEMGNAGAAMEGESERLSEQASPRERPTVNSPVDDLVGNRQPSTRPRVRVLLVDDHAMFRTGMQKLLERYEGLEIVGEASDGLEAVALATRLMPDVVVMDNNMPKLNGIEATRQICRELPAIKVIGLSMNDAKEIRAAMLEAGAIEYLQKNGSVKDLYDAIRSLFSDRT